MEQAIKHLSDFDCLADKCRRIRCANGREVASRQNVVLQLCRRIEGDSYKSRVLARTLLAAALDDIRRHGHRDSCDLTPKRCVLRSPNLSGKSMSIQRHDMGLLPDFEFSEVGHAPCWRGRPSHTSPFRRIQAPNPTATSERSMTLASRIYASVISHLCRSKLILPLLPAPALPPLLRDH
jgi:hypothetical protein